MVDRTAEASLDGFLAEYSAEVRARAENALSKLRKLLPGAVQLVYDNYNALVITFGASERPSDIVCSIALYPRWVTLFFLHGSLPDPDGLLTGSGKTIRSVVLDSDATLDARPLRTLIGQAVAHASSMLVTAKGKRLIIQSVSPKRRPRRPAAKAKAAAPPRTAAATKRATKKKPVKGRVA